MDKTADRLIDARLATGGALYQKENRIYPRSVNGIFSRWRSRSMYTLLGLFYGVVWLTWNGRQAVLFDLPTRKFYVFGLTFWPQDFIYLALLLLLCALSLFFFTALAGRLWCGYACPQTVWTEAFIRIERWIEGDRNKRMKRDRGRWTRDKVMRKTAKHFLWLTFSFWTGATFVGYFMPVRVLAADLLVFNAAPWAVFWVLFYALATYGNAGFLREQVCKYMCPYARFQGAMFDRDTLTIAYDRARGEPRGSRQRTANPRAHELGDCVDCTLCVQVCPTGIDIREGLQYECIACAACIDVCDQVMDKMAYPRGLIRYTTENALTGKPSRVLRPRVVIYAALLTIVATSMVISIANRIPLRMEVIRDRNALFRLVEDNRVENVYTLRVINMADRDGEYALRVSGPPELIVDSPQLHVAAGQAAAFPIRLRVDRDLQIRRFPVTITLYDVHDPATVVTRESRFFLPLEAPL